MPASYLDSTYSEVTTWTAETRVRYAPNKKSGKSFQRYGNYMVAKTVGEALALGCSSLDLLFDFERGLLKPAGGPRRSCPPEVTKDNRASLSCSDRVLGGLYSRWRERMGSTWEASDELEQCDESKVDELEASPVLVGDAARSPSLEFMGELVPQSMPEDDELSSTWHQSQAAEWWKDANAAAEWWKDASARWRDTITPKLRAKAARELVHLPRPGSSPVVRRPASSEADGAPPRKQPCTEARESPGGRPPATPHRISIARSPVPSPPLESPGAMKLSKTTETCGICCSEVPPHHAVQLGCCGHGWYCHCCMERHAQSRLEMGAVDVPCFVCSVPLPERHLRKLLPAPLLERLLARSLEQAVSAASDLRACPTPNCPVRVALEPGTQPRLNCPECRKTSCLLCGAQPWHRGVTCEQHAERKRGKDDELFQKWMDETGTKQCPQCRCPVTKQNLDQQSTQRAECHKMLCRNCTCRFCFKCLAVLTDDFTCGCTSALHGFIDPKTGKRREHLKPTKSRGRAR